MAPLVADSLPPPPGWRLYMCARCSGHVADTPVGEIPGYARLPPPTGVAEMLALGHRLRLGRRCGALLCSAEGADASLRLVGGACGCCELGVAHVGATLQRGWRGLNECQNRLSQVPYILLV